ncbi:MAG: DUF4215 domain-containing protein, partial [Candidatus Aenigmarchaeota archaeon]|nr:DUF4215 domain-containing protein [Candidatus Aenigmarchaeota archaeon]
MNDCKERMVEFPVKTCNGEGELYLYHGDQFQNPATSFIVNRDQVLIFTKKNYISSIGLKVDGVDAALDVVADISMPFGVKIYSADTYSGAVVSVTATSTTGAMGIQGYLAQDVADPVYNISTFEVVYDGAVSNEMYLMPDIYSYLFFDKYTLHNNGVPDNRQLNVTLTGPSGTIVDEVFTQPSPPPTEGVVFGDYVVAESGMHNLSVSTDDSIYWVLSDCPAGPYCGDGIVQSPEQCDDGNDNNTDGCTDQCIIEDCGDDIIQTYLGDECDDDGLNGVPCVPDYEGSCMYCSEICMDVTLYGPYCGDGYIDQPYEECDGDAGVGEHQTCTENCELITFCEDADIVVDVYMSVVGVDCHWSEKYTDSTVINIPTDGMYSVKGIVNRGYPCQCQENEDFYLEINDLIGPATEDDAEPCAISTRLDYLGNFTFYAGDNDVIMHTDAQCPPDVYANSVALETLCLYYNP